MRLSNLPSNDADRALVEGVLARAPGSFEQLVSEYQGLCWHIINRMVRHPDDTRELCQETFLSIHQRLGQSRFESPLKSWVGQVAYSIALRFVERKRIALVDNLSSEDGIDHVNEISDECDLEAASADAELAAGLHAEIERLPPLPRTVLVLYHLDEVPGAITTLYLSNICFAAIAASTRQFDAFSVSAVVQWSVVILVCLGFSSVVERWQKRN